MAFAVKWLQEAVEQYNVLMAAARTARESRTKSGKGKASEQEGLFAQVDTAVRLLMANPRHPGLHTHEYETIPHPYTKGGKVFEAYAQNNTPGAYRIFWCYGPGKGEITMIAITPHP